MFTARKFRHHRLCPSSNQNIFGGHNLTTGQSNFMRAGNFSALTENSHIFQIVAIQTFQPINVFLDQITQPRPVEAFAFNIPAEIIRIMQVICEMGTVNQHLLGHTTANNAGAANTIFLCRRHPRAMRCSNARRSYAA